MSARLIDGTAVSAELRRKITHAVARLKQQHGLTPGLAVVLVGSNPASEVYVRNKAAKTTDAGMRSFLHALPGTASERELLALIADLNADPAVHGILVQLPLPAQIDPHEVIAAVSPEKDVDGFHPLTAGRLALGLPGIRPCTPLGCIILAKSVHASLAGMDAVIIGRSNIVGKPLAQLLLAENTTVTIAHSRSRDLPGIARRADLLCVAVGKPELVDRSFVKPGATVIDVGINRIPTGPGKSRLVGDVAFADVADIAGAITPVPGGVGPMTIACLLLNTLQACCTANDLPEPAL